MILYIYYKKKLINKSTQENIVEYKGKFTEMRTKTKVYQIPEKYGDLSSVSAVIRKMRSDGFSRWEVHKITGIRYQHVRNVDITPLVG